LTRYSENGLVRASAAPPPYDLPTLLGDARSDQF
jgi:hypothetical protein